MKVPDHQTKCNSIPESLIMNQSIVFYIPREGPSEIPDELITKLLESFLVAER